MGWVRLRVDPALAAFASMPIGEVLRYVAFGNRSNGTPGPSVIIEPLVTPDPPSIALPIPAPSPRPDLVMDDPNFLRWLESSPPMARRMIESSARDYGSAGAFARSVDSEYLADDWDELAEAVAYSWLIAGEPARAMDRLDVLLSSASLDPVIEDRARHVRALVGKGEGGAEEQIGHWRRQRIEKLGLLPR